uniref:Uncharacterized protein n=1 Tax=Opuntia streptacantha TaxID=393608 RepID=A0A7C9CVE1_OPUST
MEGRLSPWKISGCDVNSQLGWFIVESCCCVMFIQSSAVKIGVDHMKKWSKSVSKSPVWKFTLSIWRRHCLRSMHELRTKQMATSIRAKTCIVNLLIGVGRLLFWFNFEYLMVRVQRLNLLIFRRFCVLCFYRKFSILN